MSVQRTPAAKFEDVPGSLPDAQVPDDVDLDAIANLALEWLNDLHTEQLASNAIWRDILSFTDTFRTFYSIETVYTTLQKLSKDNQRSTFSLMGSKTPRFVKSGDSSWLDVDVAFKVHHGSLVGLCSGIVSLTQESPGEWKIWMLRTWLENYEGHGHPDEPVADEAHQNGTTNGVHEHVYDVVFVGGGQGGLGAAGRSKALGIDYILFDERPAIGDAWAHRYDSLKWHTIREYGNLPFGRTFPSDKEDLLPKDRIAAGYKGWSEQYSINVQAGTEVKHSTWDEQAEIWTVSTTGSSGDQTWKTRNLVLCIGPGHKKPVVPEWATEDKIKASGYKGTILHSVNYHNASAWAGKRGIVVGTANTAHDVAEDMADLSMTTTMLQRSPTFIFPGEWLVKAHSTEYNVNKPTAISDREQVTPPSKIQRAMTMNAVWSLIKKNPKRFDDLEKAGFKLDRFGDLYTNLYVRYGGHYVDIGSCARIVKGEIKVKTVPVEGLTEDGIRFEDGGEIGADLIVLATGFNHDFRKDAADIVGQENADRMDDYWNIDKEGELRGYSRLAGHPHLFYHGAEARLARFYSRSAVISSGKCNVLTWRQVSCVAIAENKAWRTIEAISGGQIIPIGMSLKPDYGGGKQTEKPEEPVVKELEG